MRFPCILPCTSILSIPVLYIQFNHFGYIFYPTFFRICFNSSEEHYLRVEQIWKDSNFVAGWIDTGLHILPESNVTSQQSHKPLYDQDGTLWLNAIILSYDAVDTKHYEPIRPKVDKYSYGTVAVAVALSTKLMRKRNHPGPASLSIITGVTLVEFSRL